MNAPTCVACQRPLEDGFLIDRGGDYPNESVFWVRGSLWSALLGRAKTYPVTTWRCPACGLLQSYAGSPARRGQDAHEADDHLGEHSWMDGCSTVPIEGSRVGQPSHSKNGGHW